VVRSTGEESDQSQLRCPADGLTAVGHRELAIEELRMHLRHRGAIAPPSYAADGSVPDVAVSGQ